MLYLGAWNRDQGVNHFVGSYRPGIFPLNHFSGLLCDNQLFSLGPRRRGSATMLRMHANIPRQALIHIFLGESRKRSLYFIKLLVSAQCFQKSSLDHRRGGAEDLWKENIRKLGTWEFMDVKVNFQAYKLQKSWQMHVWFKKRVSP